MVHVRIDAKEVRKIPRASFARLARYLGCSTGFVITEAVERARRNPVVRRGRKVAA